MKVTYVFVATMALLAALYRLTSADPSLPIVLIVPLGVAAAVSFIHGLVALLGRTSGVRSFAVPGARLGAIFGRPSRMWIAITVTLLVISWVVVMAGIIGTLNGVPEQTMDKSCPYSLMDHGQRTCITDGEYRSLVARSESAFFAAAAFFAGIGSLLIAGGSSVEANRATALARP